MKHIKIFIITTLALISFSKLFAKDIPVLVISPGKSIQSESVVGSTVEVVTSDDIENSSQNGIAHIIEDFTTSTNLFQAGGMGTNVGIQLRGIEKRYSTVYIDGVKMLDPSSADGSFYLENVMKTGIERVEVLRGVQSSLYGGNAIGGAINIFTKKGREGKHSDFSIETASADTKNISYSMDGDDGKFSYFLGGSNLVTDGISAMSDNQEEDGYKNNSIIGNMGYKISDNFRLENSFRLADSYAEYDQVAAASNDKDTFTDNLEASGSIKLIHENNKFKNTLAFNKLQIERATESQATAGTVKRETYFGYRDGINYLGEYNFSLDNKIVYGVDAEFDAARYKKSFAGNDPVLHDEAIISQYFDYQFRPFEKLYSTFGLRSDDHTTVGRKTSGRATVAYQLDGNSKIRSSLGSGVRFPALYDYRFGSSNLVSQGSTLEDLQSERGNSFDLGYDTYLDNLDLGLNITYFNVVQKNSIESGDENGWVQRNGVGRNTSEGVELSGNWKPTSKDYSLGLGYTFTDSYDGQTCDAHHRDAWSDNECRVEGSAVSQAKVRVPRHALQAKVNYSFSPKFTTSLKGKYRSETRDFGNDNDPNGGWTDAILTDYYTFDLNGNYKIFDGYDLNFGISNLLDEEYYQAYDYSAPGRAFTVKLKRAL